MESTMTDRFRRVVEEARAEQRKLAGIFFTNGFPTLPASREILKAIDAGGADFIEIGMPFSDPLAEGIPIQRSSAAALSQGLKMADTLETARIFRRESETPLFLMGYINPILKYGVSNFFEDADSCGVDGLIIPDLPPGSSPEFEKAAQATGLGMVHLIAPNSSNDRIREVDRLTTAFVYAVSVTGLTGSDIGSTDRVDEYLKRAQKMVTRNPLLVGFGIKSHREAADLSRHTDGYIVGSAIITRVEKWWKDPSLSDSERLELVRNFIESLRGENVSATRG